MVAASKIPIVPMALFVMAITNVLTLACVKSMAIVALVNSAWEASVLGRNVTKTVHVATVWSAVRALALNWESASTIPIVLPAHSVMPAHVGF